MMLKSSHCKWKWWSLVNELKGEREIANKQHTQKNRRKFSFNEGNLSGRIKWNVYVSAAVPARWFCWCCYCSMLLVHALGNSKNRKRADSVCVSVSVCVCVRWNENGVEIKEFPFYYVKIKCSLSKQTISHIGCSRLCINKRIYNNMKKKKVNKWQTVT